MSKLNGWKLLCALAGFVVPITQAVAACDGADFNAWNTWSASTAQEARRCLSEMNSALTMPKCSLGICKEVQAFRDDGKASRVPEGAAVLDRVRLHFAPTVTGFALAREVDAPMLKFQQELKKVSVESVRDPAKDPLRQIESRRWAFNSVEGTLLEEGGQAVHIGDFVNAECAASEARCSAALRGSASTVFHAWLFQVTATSLLNDARAEFVNYVGMLDKRWESYFDKGRFQYPWELWLNGARFHRERGFAGPPNDQWILLHPSIGYRYAGGNNKHLAQTLYLELAGYYAWQWDGAAATKQRGASLVASWADTPGEQRKGIGFLVHMPKNYSLGLISEKGASSGRRLALVLSMDLGKIVQDPVAQKKALVDSVK